MPVLSAKFTAADAGRKSGSTPFRLNLHVDDVGHTLIFGPTGSGKSTLLALIAAQFRRYENAQIFAFDKGRSLLPLTLAPAANTTKSAAYGEGGGMELSFCPLEDLSTDEDRAWAAEWIETLVVMQGVTMTPDLRNAISRQIRLMAASNARSLDVGFRFGRADFGNQGRAAPLHRRWADGPLA
jgi:type IV secretory pathway VirB4 component